MPEDDSSSSIRNPSDVTVISIWFLSLSKFAICRTAFCSSSFSFGMLSLVRVKFSPDPIWLLPTFLEVPVGSLKYPPTATCICLLLFISQSTMNSAIMAVTKSA